MLSTELKQRMRILAVDDNHVNLELIQAVAESAGYEVLTVDNGPDALTAAESESPDIIILDISMPKMDGYEVCRYLKSDSKTRDIPVIMLTALFEVSSKVEGLDAGADDYLTKPFSASELLARIDRRLRAKGESDQLRQKQEQLRETFSRFVAPSVVEAMLKDPARVKLGGVLQKVTVMFADLQNFTTISETSEPEALLAALNGYHELLVQVIQSMNGTIDKFMGDAVMSLFNAPLEQEDHTRLAVRAALMIRSMLPDYHQQLDQIFHMQVNIGIHTGQAIVGFVGAPQLMDYTAVGDTVNVAARLQGQGHDGQIIISEEVYRAVEDEIDARLLGQRQLKGRSYPITLYEVLGYR
jgi:adenylate cyclase